MDSARMHNGAEFQLNPTFWLWLRNKVKVKVKSSMAKSLPVENLLPQNVGSIINYLL